MSDKKRIAKDIEEVKVPNKTKKVTTTKKEQKETSA